MHFKDPIFLFLLGPFCLLIMAVMHGLAKGWYVHQWKLPLIPAGASSQQGAKKNGKPHQD